MIFVKLSCTENWSIQNLKKTSHRFQLCQIVDSDRLDWVHTTQMGEVIGGGVMAEGKLREGCTTAPASWFRRRRRCLGEDSVDESSSRPRRVDFRQVGVDGAPESMK